MKYLQHKATFWKYLILCIIIQTSLERAFEKLLSELEDNQLKLEGDEDEEQLSRSTMDFLRVKVHLEVSQR